MPKCLECGFEAPRLQWTHFKFKCTGKFTNGKEYMKAYAGAKTVDEELAKRTAVSLATLVQKYGEQEGNRRWVIYKEKQSHSNSFEYKKQKHGWSEEEYREYNLSRSITPETMVKKYGLEEGIRRYQKYCDKQKLTKSKDYVVAKYGIDKWIEINTKKANANSPKFISDRDGISLDEAVAKVAARYKNAYVSDLELEFVNELEKLTGPLSHTNNNTPFGKWSNDMNRYVVYDVKHGNCIVEFHGDYWHANPKIYSADDLIRGKRAQDIWLQDEQKLDIARNAGLNVMVVWESDYLARKEQILEEVSRWILNTQK